MHGVKGDTLRKYVDHTYDNFFFYSFLFTCVSFLFSLFIQMQYGAHWIICLIGSIVVGIVAAYVRDINQFIRLDKSMRMCPKCGKENRKEAYFCSKCGKATYKSIENTVRVYSGNDIAAEFILQYLEDAGIIAWKNTYYGGGFFLPTFVYVFQVDNEAAVKIVKVITGGNNYWTSKASADEEMKRKILVYFLAAIELVPLVVLLLIELIKFIIKFVKQISRNPLQFYNSII